MIKNPLDEIKERNRIYKRNIIFTTIAVLGISVFILKSKNQDLQRETEMALALLKDAGLEPKLITVPIIPNILT